MERIERELFPLSTQFINICHQNRHACSWLGGLLYHHCWLVNGQLENLLSWSQPVVVGLALTVVDDIRPFILGFPILPWVNIPLTRALQPTDSVFSVQHSALFPFPCAIFISFAVFKIWLRYIRLDAWWWTSAGWLWTIRSIPCTYRL